MVFPSLCVCPDADAAVLLSVLLPFPLFSFMDVAPPPLHHVLRTGLSTLWADNPNAAMMERQVRTAVVNDAPVLATAQRNSARLRGLQSRGKLAQSLKASDRHDLSVLADALPDNLVCPRPRPRLHTNAVVHFPCDPLLECHTGWTSS